MSKIKTDSVVENVIKILCCSFGWSYGAFWSYGQPNSILLNLQDSYFKEEFKSLIDNLLLQVPIGGGIIGQAAHTNKHMWMCSEDHYRDQIFSGSIWDMFLDDYELRSQFSSGMKTIAVIPVEPQGVVQFGSSEKIPERIEFVNQTKQMFQEIVNGAGGNATGLTTLNGHNCITNELLETRDFNVSQWFPPLNPIGYDGKHEPLTVSGSEVDLFGNNGDLRDILAPILNGNQPGLQSFGQVDHAALGSKERLFSKLGIQEFLEGVSGISNAGSSSCLEDQVSVKRRKTGNDMWEESQETMHKPNQGLRMVDGYSMSGSSTVLQVEPPKPAKKKAKPGTRPRPKDRQQILDRMAELRQLIPNGEKMSIDCLLDRTIKHMIFLQNVMRQADKIKQADELRTSKVNNNQDLSTNGVTWACELGNQAMVCPLIVEDVGAHGQMLIEMLYEEKGLFLEIADMIRRFGLTILKGVMEDRGDYIWARFIVEPEVNKHITRQEIFTSLVQFLQATVPEVDKNAQIPGTLSSTTFI
ncbi:transcription factor bHLH157-like [Bidens hawaiensis]|uniref:transcription factor bHLH157-like n=1 Tax=Bidens hawaiensis TaxID=980011 RepID=UPI00404A500A